MLAAPNNEPDLGCGCGVIGGPGSDFIRFAREEAAG